jgi:hypothetical protein
MVPLDRLLNARLIIWLRAWAAMLAGPWDDRRQIAHLGHQMALLRLSSSGGM